MSGKFHFVANNLALDFVNTLIVDEKGRPLELLNSADDLLEWNSAAGRDDTKNLVFAGADGSEMFERALSLRSELKKMAKALSERRTVPKSVIAAINDLLSRSRGHFELSSTPQGYETHFQMDSLNAPDLLVKIADSAARLLSEGDLSLVRKCQNSACVLYFYDVSKRHGRQWCSMSACGNRAKAAAFYKRTREK